MSKPKQYQWTAHKFWCDECEATRYASQEAIDGDRDDDCTAAEIVDCFIVCLACSYGDDWAKECANPEGELPIAEHSVAVYAECAATRSRTVVTDPEQVLELQESGNGDVVIYTDTVAGHLDFAKSCERGGTAYLRAIGKGIREGMVTL